MFAVASRVDFEIGPTSAVATQLVFVPMLFLAPLPLVPLLVALGYLLGELPDFIRGATHPDRWLYCIGDAWFTVGPVLVIGLLAPGEPSTADTPAVYVLAVARADRRRGDPPAGRSTASCAACRRASR